MGRTRIVATLIALAAGLALMLAGCGSSSGSPSTSDPAQIVPSSSLAYFEITVRPQGSQRSDAQTALSKLIGPRANPDLQRLGQSLFKSSGLNYQRDIQPWLGQRVGFVVVTPSSAGIALVAPTSNTSAALAALEKAERNARLAPESYHGVNYQFGTDSSGKPVAIGIVGHDAVVGGPSAFTAIIDASHSGSLASSSSFGSAFSSLDSSAIMRGYLDGRALASALTAKLLSSPTATPALRQQLGPALSRLRGTIAFGLTLAPKAITFQVHLSTPSRGNGADVGGLPGQSWLALATGKLSANTQALLSMEQPGPSAAALDLFRQRFGIDLIHDVLPALGPLQLSIRGTKLSSLGAGLVVTPSNLAAAGRVLGAIYTRAAHSPSVTVQGKPTAFTVTKPGQPIPRFAIAELGRRVVATFDEAFSQVTSPSSKLSDDPSFQRAKAALGGDGRVPFFLDFTTLAAFTGQIPSFQAGGRDNKDQVVLQRLDYLAIGENPAAGDVRAVLGLR